MLEKQKAQASHMSFWGKLRWGLRQMIFVFVVFFAESFAALYDDINLKAFTWFYWINTVL